MTLSEKNSNQVEAELSNNDNSQEVSGKRIKSFIEKIERLEEERKAVAEDIKDVYGEAKAMGFDAPTIRKLVAIRKKNPEKAAEAQELLELYASAAGIQLPLL
jgi:uncharacterized protein (UPF0335 family)